MPNQRLTLEYDAEDAVVWLVLASTDGVPHREPLWLRGGFSVEDVRQALGATGWVVGLPDAPLVTSDVNAEFLRDVVEDMLGYFKTPGEPTDYLREVRASVEAGMPGTEDAPSIPWLAYAWLDWIVRDDLADETRSTPDLWSQPQAVVELKPLRERRIRELVARYAPRPDRPRLAGSRSTRPVDAARDKRTG